MIQLIPTSDGSHTIFVPELNEHYHSIHGAVQESEIVFIRNGFEYCKADPVNILEIGFGTGLNALLTAVKSIETGRKVLYTALEKYPLPEDIVNKLNHYSFAGEKGKTLFMSIHSTQWNVFRKISGNFSLKKMICDITASDLEGRFDLIYFDAFSPDKQPEMWTYDILKKVATVTVSDGIFVTYSAKGDVKRKLKACGFDIFLLPGPPGKRQMIRAVRH